MGNTPNGLIFLTKYIAQLEQFHTEKKLNKQKIDNIISFYLGSHEKKLIIGDIPAKYVKDV
jgi:hypothetical protein